MTKKMPVKGRDSSRQLEQTIVLDENEYNALMKLKGKRLHKTRYFYRYNRKTAEFGIFKERLEGLIIVDFEFKSLEKKDSFKIPDFCLADVTQEKFAAGGILCGKSYGQIKKNLKRYKYKKLFLG